MLATALHASPSNSTAVRRASDTGSVSKPAIGRIRVKLSLATSLTQTLEAVPLSMLPNIDAGAAGAAGATGSAGAAGAAGASGAAADVNTLEAILNHIDDPVAMQVSLIKKRCERCKMAVRKRHGTAVSFPSVALIVRMLDGDALDQVFGHIGRDGRAHLALWLVCKAFSARRPTGALETSANAMCDTPALLKWAIQIGLRPHHLQPRSLTPPWALVLLKTIRPKLGANSVSYTGFETAEMARFGDTIRRMFYHTDKRVSVYAKQTAVALLKQLAKLEPAAFLEPVALTEFLRFIMRMLSSSHSATMDHHAKWALWILMSTLRDMAAHVLLAGVIAKVMTYSDRPARDAALDTISRLGHDALAHHASHIARVVHYESMDEHAYRCCQVFRVLLKLSPAVLVQFTGMLVVLLWNEYTLVRRDALEAIGLLDQTAFRMAAVAALGRMNGAALARDVVAIVGLIKHPNEAVRYVAVTALGMLDSVALTQHAGAVATIATMLDDTDDWVRAGALCALDKLPAAEVKEYAGAIARAASTCTVTQFI